MDLTNDFEVGVGIDQAWDVLNDVERIAPCLPGAQLQEIEDGEYRGIVKVKVGPITSQYKGKAIFVEQNREAYRVVLKGDGRDTRGAGNASALITATLESVTPDRTKVNVSTDLTVTGKVAQFGRGVMADISSKLMGQFADNLETMLAEQGASVAGGTDAPITKEHLAGAMATAATSVVGSEASPSSTTASPSSAASATTAGTNGAGSSTGPRKVNMAEPDAVDLLDAAGTPVMKRVMPIAGGALVLMLLRRLLRARRG